MRGFAATVDAEAAFTATIASPPYLRQLVGGLLDARRLRDDAALATSPHDPGGHPYLPPRPCRATSTPSRAQDFSEHAWDESYTLPENQFRPGI